MKTLGVQTKFLALATVIGLVSLGVSAAPGTASITATQGAVTGGERGDSLSVGSVISTGAGSTAAVNINGDMLSLHPNTTLVIETLESDDTGVEKVGNVLLDLTAGQIYGKLRKSSALSKFIVKIPNGQVSVDASQGPVEFNISANGDVSVGEGSLVVTFNRGTATAANVVTVNMNGNQTFNPISGTVAQSAAPIAAPAVQTTTVASAPAAPVQPFQFFISPNLGGTD